MSDCTSLSLNLRPINRLANLSAQDYIKADGACDVLGIIYCTDRVGGVLILSCVSNQTFFIVESHITRSDSVALIIYEDFDFAYFQISKNWPGGQIAKSYRST